MRCNHPYVVMTLKMPITNKKMGVLLDWTLREFTVNIELETMGNLIKGIFKS